MGTCPKTYSQSCRISSSEGDETVKPGFLIIALLIFAAANAAGAALEWKALRWTVAGYWFLVGVYWLMKSVECS